MIPNDQMIRKSRSQTLINLLSFLAIIASLLGCSPAHSAKTKIKPVANDEDHNRYFREGYDLIKPHMMMLKTPAEPSSPTARADISQGIALLNAVITYNPTNWSAWWIMGKGYQSLDEPAKACDAFGKSYALHRDNPDVAREYMIECLNLGRTAEAMSAAGHAVTISPQDAGLYANLALAYTLAGRISDAQCCH